MQLFLRPARDADGQPLLVRDPQSMRPLKPEGEWKDSSTYWQRRIRDRDVTDATAEVNAIAPSVAAAMPASPFAAT
jgi:hypothetical protein